MPQCQFPVFCYFCVSEVIHRKYSRNWMKQVPEVLFCPKLPEIRRGVGEGLQARLTHGWRGPGPGRATMVWGSLGPLLTSPLRLYKASGRKNLKESMIFPEQFRSSAAVEDKFRGTEVSVPAPRRVGEVPPEPSPPSPSTSPPYPSTLLSPMMRRE
jgi:hypothetical protein